MILLGDSGNLSGGKTFLALDTCATVIRHQWVVLPMPSSVIDRVNFIGRGQDIGENPQYADPAGNEDLESVVAYPTGNTGVYPVVDDNHIAGVDPGIAVKPTGVDIEEVFEAYDPLERAEPDSGLRH